RTWTGERRFDEPSRPGMRGERGVDPLAIVSRQERAGAPRGGDGVEEREGRSAGRLPPRLPPVQEGRLQARAARQAPAEGAASGWGGGGGQGGGEQGGGGGEEVARLLAAARAGRDPIALDHDDLAPGDALVEVDAQRGPPVPEGPVEELVILAVVREPDVAQV